MVKSKYMLLISILIFIVALFFLWNGDNNAIGIALLMIVMLLNVIRGIVNLWNERIVK